jgi:signal transduction histidine kinase
VAPERSRANKYKGDNKLSRKKILIIEDDGPTIELCATILRNESFDVAGVRNGQRAIEIARKDHFDLFLVDIMMPGLDGFDTMQAIREFQPDLVCVAMTGYSNMHTVTRALDLRFDEYLAKPFSPDKLVQAVKRAFAGTGLLHRFGIYKAQITAVSNNQYPLAEFSHLIDGIVHDMRSGLGVIRNTLGFLEDDLSAEDHQSDLLKISRSLDFCELVLRNLSALGGQDIFQPERVNLEGIVRETFFILERKLVDVELIVDTDPNVPEILADEGQMKQVFMNLIKNAGEAMPDGGTLTVRTRREGDMLCIEIRDTGCGISPENQGRLFEEFSTTKDRGYGLGLHIVNTIVKRHGGTVAVESEIDEGTTFILHLPIEAE